ncbi:MAG: hypothetical protein ACYS21_06310, partial [Planctomycetota bacterium]
KPVKPPGGGGGGEVGQLIPVNISFLSGGIQSDDSTKPVYSDGDLKKKVTAIVGRNFNIVLEPNNSNKKTAGRTLWLDLSNAIMVPVQVNVSDGAGGDVDGICDDYVPGVPDLPTVRFGPITSGQKSGCPDNAKLEILGRDLDGLGVVDNVEGRQSMVDTNARLKFSVGGQSWILHWGPHKAPGGWTYAPGTAPVTVTRLDLDTWRIENLTGDACLYRDNNPPHRATEYHGQVTVQFSMIAGAINHEETVWGDEPWGIELGVSPCVDP